MSIILVKVEFRVGEDVPARPVAEKAWLKATGPLPRAIGPSSSLDPSYDIRLPEDGGCDPPIHFDGCHVFYIKVSGIFGAAAGSFLCCGGGFGSMMMMMWWWWWWW